eukprot:5120346-Amphidinium_carterae.1
MGPPMVAAAPIYRPPMPQGHGRAKMAQMAAKPGSSHLGRVDMEGVVGLLSTVIAQGSANDRRPPPARLSAKTAIEDMIRDHGLSAGCAWM